MRKLFFDSYALCEIVSGNPHYTGFVQDASIILTQLNLMEFYYHLIMNYGKEEAEKMVMRYEEFSVPFSTDTMMEAMDFRKANSRRKLSYADCIGYIVAKRSGALFLTGDEQFRDLPNVLFVK